MLNENLSKLRKERGLTQEALAVKLNVVRQTISKWENGTAVPDADTLCKIADSLEVSVADLLGSPVSKDSADMTLITKSLAEINEQLAVRNRRSNRVVRVVLGIVIGILILIVILIILNLSVGTPVINDKENVQVVMSGESAVSISIELDQEGIPLFEQINQRNEHALAEFFGSGNITDEQLIAAWGKPIKESKNSLSWQITDKYVFTVYFSDGCYAYDCGIESK